MGDLDRAVESIEQGRAWGVADEVMQLEVKEPLSKVIKQKSATPAKERRDIGLRACGPWLRYSFLKRVGLTIVFWPIHSLIGVKASMPLWLKYFCWRWPHIGKPLTWGDIAEHPDPDDFHELLPLDFCWAVALAGKRQWLWYEPLEQLQRNKDNITYPVDWEGKSNTWYPFW